MGRIGEKYEVSFPMPIVSGDLSAIILELMLC